MEQIDHGQGSLIEFFIELWKSWPVAASHSTVSCTNVKSDSSWHLSSWLCRGTKLRKHERQRGLGEKWAIHFGQLLVSHHKSLFELVWDLNTLKFCNKFGIKVSDLTNVNSKWTSTYLLDEQVPELGYKPFKIVWELKIRKETDLTPSFSKLCPRTNSKNISGVQPPEGKEYVAGNTSRR